MPVLFGYWKIKGLGQSIRLALEYTGVDYTEKQYVIGDAPTFDVSCWTNEKYTLGLDFPNLPYYIDGDFKLSQSEAILSYVCEKHGLGGKTPQETATIQMIGAEIHDFHIGFGTLCYNPDFHQMKAAYLENLAKRFTLLSKYLGNKKWLTGEEIRYPDFHFYELLESHKRLDEKCLDKFPNLQKYVDRFEKLPKIAEYMKSDRFIKKPMMSKMATFGSDC